jgi:hypothetical protein
VPADLTSAVPRDACWSSWDFREATERMTSRTLSKRLERLETRTIPAGDPLVVRTQFVSPDGNVEDDPRITVPGAGGRRVGKGPVRSY